VKIWNPIDGKFEMSLEGHSKGISDISWASNSKYICSASDDKTIKIWDITTVSIAYGKSSSLESSTFPLFMI
jgi:COMPASS component SWD3